MGRMKVENGSVYKAKLLGILQEHFANLDGEQLADEAGCALNKDILYEGNHFFIIDDICPY